MIIGFLYYYYYDFIIFILLLVLCLYCVTIIDDGIIVNINRYIIYSQINVLDGS